MEIPIEEIPEDFVPLKNYFKILLDRTSEKFFLVILLDAIEIFFVNSHQNGATSWIPRDLPPNVKVVITFTSNPDDDTEEKAKFLRGFSEGVTEENNLLHLGELGADLAEKVLKYWLESINRKLTNYQWRVAMNAMHTCSLALFLDLCFSLLRNWKSYDPPEVTVIPQSINAAILELFANVERKYGRILVSHAVSFITASKSGLSETELEDILCLDEQVLDEVFRFQLPLVRRIPPILWTKIRRDLKDHFTEHDADGSRVVVWAHKQFRDVAIQLYLTHESISVYLHGIMSDYFMGIWSGGRPKPFKYTELHRQRLKVSGRMGESDRKLPSQPNVFKGTDGKVSRYNMRKFAELPFHLIGSGRIVDLCDQVLFNYLWLHAKISAVPIDGILDDFTRALHIIKDPALKRQVLLVLGALKLSRTVLDKYPDMLAAHLIARLLPEIKHHMSLRSLIQQCDHDGFIHNCLVPLRHYLASPGGPLKYSLEGHNFAIFGCSLTNDKRYVVSISNRFISWDITTSEICRDIDPRSDGMILGLAVSSDDRYAAAFTSSNQLVIIDIMLGHYIKVEKPMEKMDDIVDITIIGKRVVVYNSKYWRAFDMSGQHLSSDNFSILLSDVLSMIFVSEDVFLSLHWSGDQDYDDTRIWIQPVVKGDKSEPVLVFNAFEMASFSQDRLIYFACQKADAAISSYNIDSPGSSRKWSIIRYEQDPRGNAKEKAAVICAETEDVFGLTLHNSQKSSCLSAAVSEGFLLIFQPLCGDSGQLGRQLKRLSLPRSVVNIRLKLNKSNPSIGIFDDAQMFIAGVRRDIFVWNWEKEQLLRSFAGHSGRILEMKALLSPSQRIFVSSSADKTIKVWDVDQLLEYVHPIDKMDLKIDKLVCCEKLKIVVSLTRGGLGFWNLETGALDYKLSDNAGGFVTDVVVASNGKYFVTAENNEKVLTWNLSSRVVLYKDNQADVHQLLLLEEISPHLILAVSSLKCNKTGCDLYRVVARSEGGKRVYKFDCQINREFPLIVTDDQHFLAILGFDRAKNKECVSVFHSKKGVFLHKVLLKYPHIKRPLKFEAFSESSCVIVDSEKGNIIDLRNKCFVRSIRNWTGQAIGEDYRYGLSAPNSGGLRYMDLKNGHVLHSVLENAAEGVFTIHAQFTRCGRYILYYHNSRKTVRLFTRPECKLVANFCLHSEATAFVSTADGNRLIIGGLDGTVTFLVVAHNSAEELENTRSMLTKLPSRRLHNQPPKANLAGSEDELEDFYSNSLTEELRQRRLKKQATLRRFRAVAKVALMMDRICRNVKASKKSKANRANVNTCPLS